MDHAQCHPATPLPWSVEQPAHQLSKRIVGASKKDRSTVAGIVSSVTDASYIAHAANAYPKLIEALRDTIKREKVGCINRAENLLRELGEAP